MPIQEEDINIDYVYCSNCHFNLSEDEELWKKMYNMGEYDDFFVCRCPECSSPIKIVLTIFQSYDYKVKQPLATEIDKLEKEENKIKDCDGQTFLDFLNFK